MKLPQPTVPGGQRQPGKHASETQGWSAFWQFLAHSKPFSPASHFARTSGGAHVAERLSASSDANKGITFTWLLSFHCRCTLSSFAGRCKNTCHTAQEGTLIAKRTAFY